MNALRGTAAQRVGGGAAAICSPAAGGGKSSGSTLRQHPAARPAPRPPSAQTAASATTPSSSTGSPQHHQHKRDEFPQHDRDARAGLPPHQPRLRRGRRDARRLHLRRQRRVPAAADQRHSAGHSRAGPGDARPRCRRQLRPLGAGRDSPDDHEPPVRWRPRARGPGRNSFGTLGYRGPCPPRGAAAHHYVLTLSALSAPSGPARRLPGRPAQFAGDRHRHADRHVRPALSLRERGRSRRSAAGRPGHDPGQAKQSRAAAQWTQTPAALDGDEPRQARHAEQRGDIEVQPQPEDRCAGSTRSSSSKMRKPE